MTRLVSTGSCKGIFAPPIRLITFPSTIGKNRVCTNVSGSRVYTYTSMANLIKGANCFQLIFKVAFVEAYHSFPFCTSIPSHLPRKWMGGRQRWENKIIVVGRWFPRPNRKPVFKPLFQFHGLPSPSSFSSSLKNSKVIIIVKRIYNVQLQCYGEGNTFFYSGCISCFVAIQLKKKKERKNQRKD